MDAFAHVANERDPLQLLSLSEEHFQSRFAALNYFQLLRVTRNAPRTDVERAHRQLSALYNPEVPRNRNYPSQGRLAAITLRLNEAKLHLIDTDLRERYEASLETTNDGNDVTDNDLDLAMQAISGGVNFSASYRAKMRELEETMRHRQEFLVIVNNGATIWKDMETELFTKTTWNETAAAIYDSILADAVTDLPMNPVVSSAFQAQIRGILQRDGTLYNKVLSLFRQRLSPSELAFLLSVLSEHPPAEAAFQYTLNSLGSPASVAASYLREATNAFLGYWAQPVFFLRAYVNLKMGEVMDCVHCLEMAILTNTQDRDEVCRLVSTILHECQLLSGSMAAFLDLMFQSLTVGVVVEKGDSVTEEGRVDRALALHLSPVFTFETASFGARLVESRTDRVLKRCERSVLAGGAQADAERVFEAAMSMMDLAVTWQCMRRLTATLIASATLLVKYQAMSSNLCTKIAASRITQEVLALALSYSGQLLEPALQALYVSRAWVIAALSAEDLARHPQAVDDERCDHAREEDKVLIWDTVVSKLTANLAVSTGRAYPLSASFSRQSFSPSDVIYFTLIFGRELQSNVLNMAGRAESVNVAAQTSDPILTPSVAALFLLDASWKAWLPDEDFAATKQKAMQEALAERGWRMSQVEASLQWPVLKRGDDGHLPIATDAHLLQLAPMEFQRRTVTQVSTSWLFWTTKTTKTEVKWSLPTTVYKEVKGGSVDLRTGEVKLDITPATEEKDALVKKCDLDVIFRGGIAQAAFTLDHPDGYFSHHPFQEMRFTPTVPLENSDIVATMLHADYILKMLSMGIEIAAVEPFASRLTINGILSQLPPHLKQACRPVCCRPRPAESNGGIVPFGQAHRFWIEPMEDIDVSQHIANSDGVLTFSVAMPKMGVKCHKLRRNEHGELVDDENYDRANPSPEQAFAADLTRHYDELARYFPVFARLRELARMLIVYRVVANVRLSKEASLRDETIPARTARFTQTLSEIRNKLYDKDLQDVPRETSNNVERLFTKTLRQNNVSEHQVSYSERVKVRNDIRESLSRAETAYTNQVTDALSSNFLPTRKEQVRTAVRSWYTGGDHVRLAEQMASWEVEQIRSFLATYESAGIAAPMDMSGEHLNPPDAGRCCAWVRSVYLDTDQLALAHFGDDGEFLRRSQDYRGYQVFGGVQLSAQIRSQVSSRPITMSHPQQYRGSAVGQGFVRGGNGDGGGAGGRTGGAVGGGGSRGGGGNFGPNRPPPPPGQPSSQQPRQQQVYYRPRDARGNIPGPSRTVYSEGRPREPAMTHEQATRLMTRMQNSENFRAKVIGQAQHTGAVNARDGGHALEAQRYAARVAADPSVTKVALDRSYRTFLDNALGISLPSGLGRGRPDVLTAHTKSDGRVVVTCIEVPSVTDRPQKLYERFVRNVEPVRKHLASQGVTNIDFVYATQQQTRGVVGNKNQERMEARLAHHGADDR